MNPPASSCASSGAAPRASPDVPSRLQRWLPWPAPALLAWLAAWALHAELLVLGAPAGVAFATATGTGAAVSLLAAGRWRQGLVMAGFPLSAAALGVAAGVPAWGWLAALAVLLVAYPVKAWRDAPFFPTPATALDGLATLVSLPTQPRILDAGCGLGHGLHALQRQWPDARLEGLEWSGPLRLLAGWRCPRARIRRADMWAESWVGVDLVYLFQRPESMARALAKAQREMAPGSWLVSLEFEVGGLPPHGRLGADGAKPVWVYRIGAPTDALGDAASIAGRTGR